MALNKDNNRECKCDPGVAVCTVNFIILGLGLASYLYSKIES